MATCQHGHSMPDDLIVALPDSQAGTGRHKCVVCAFGLGLSYSIHGAVTEPCHHDENRAPTDILVALPASQAGLGRHKCTVCAFVEGLARGASDLDIGNTALVHETEHDLPETVQGALEGTESYREHRVLERSARNRALALLHLGTDCAACGFNFDEVYTPEHAREFIEVHHIKPLSQGLQYVNPLQDLVPLCANCHRMVHRRANRWLTIDELKELLNKAKKLTA